MKIYLPIYCIFYLIACKAQNKFELTAKDFQKNISKNNIQLLDVRTESEFNSQRIENALWANWNEPKEFELRIQFLDKDNAVYVYCLSGARSASAAKKMRKMGFKNVLELKGGINAWNNAGFKTIGNQNTPEFLPNKFLDSVAKQKIALVDFGAEWCPPCKKMKPIIEQLKNKNPNKFHLITVDGGNDKALMKKYNISSLPVFIVFKNGVQTWRKDGIASLEELNNAIQ